MTLFNPRSVARRLKGVKRSKTQADKGLTQPTKLAMSFCVSPKILLKPNCDKLCAKKANWVVTYAS